MIDEKLLKAAMKCAGVKSKTSAVKRALEERVRQQKLQGLLGMEGKIEIENNWRDLEDAELRESKPTRKPRKRRSDVVSLVENDLVY